ncbi:hypothetical protein EWM64_g9367 [Hericium alpestre]|uniref:Uncharacterized protein n=1 Tax=Hericium alpestre TaxID=135208 RepID=A0A4Y9ZIN8_9AGAM|nr:hypothetical protein EWM64_g9367 [Hericium alpestre]
MREFILVKFHAWKQELIICSVGMSVVDRVQIAFAEHGLQEIGQFMGDQLSCYIIHCIIDKSHVAHDNLVYATAEPLHDFLLQEMEDNLKLFHLIMWQPCEEVHLSGGLQFWSGHGERRAQNAWKLCMLFG